MFEIPSDVWRKKKEREQTPSGPEKLRESESSQVYKVSEYGDELNIRIILQARAERPEMQAAIERAIGGAMDFSKVDRPHILLDDKELLRRVWKSWDE